MAIDSVLNFLSPAWLSIGSTFAITAFSTLFFQPIIAALNVLTNREKAKASEEVAAFETYLHNLEVLTNKHRPPQAIAELTKIYKQLVESQKNNMESLNKTRRDTYAIASLINDPEGFNIYHHYSYGDADATMRSVLSTSQEDLIKELNDTATDLANAVKSKHSITENDEKRIKDALTPNSTMQLLIGEAIPNGLQGFQNTIWYKTLKEYTKKGASELARDIPSVESSRETSFESTRRGARK